MMSAQTSIDRIEFTKLHESAIIPSRAHEGDAGLDLHASEAVTFTGQIGEQFMVGTGVSVAIPHGWVGLVCPRSGLAAKHGITLTNAPGVIDSGYRGELRVLVTATRATTLELGVGDRIAQLVVVPAFIGPAVETTDLGEGVRGESGFGSSGGFGS